MCLVEKDVRIPNISYKSNVQTTLINLKQRIKSFKELINEYLTLDNLYRKGQGKRTDLTSVKSNIS